MTDQKFEAWWELPIEENVKEVSPIYSPWVKYQATSEYAAVRADAKVDQNVDGALFRAFEAGFFAALLGEKANEPF